LLSYIPEHWEKAADNLEGMPKAAAACRVQKRDELLTTHSIAPRTSHYVFNQRWQRIHGLVFQVFLLAFHA